ncbi:S10 family peptidase [Ramlibacter sp. PS4R-6]|uniref:S10 family peptidase n=1 Tax=Ramlibacter sp. PS4R-6 TaxID=3133438 RepID=UPI0030B175F0
MLDRLFAAVAAAALAAALASCGGGGGGGAPPPSPEPVPPPAVGDTPLNDPTTYSVTANAALPAGTGEAHAVTHRTITLPTGTIAYTAQAGHLVARDPAGVPQAAFFHVSYTADGWNPALRPVTFFYNGGPGSATVWLHLGSFGPKRLATGLPSTTAPKPFPLVDNMETLLDTTDLVFVDAVGTGYSQAIAPNRNQTFWGVDKDAAVFRDFVVRWLAANGRDASPKYLFGESYGTTRAPVMARMLETAGVRLDGIILLSSVLNYATNCSGASLSISCAGFVPSYAQAGSYHQVAAGAPADSTANAQLMRGFVSATYDPAVVVWFSQHTPPAPALATQLEGLTGLRAQTWAANLNVDPDTYRTGVIPGTLIGRYDARVSAPVGSTLASDGDPSSTLIGSQFAQAIGPYLNQTLRYSSPSAYATGSAAINSWDFRHDGQPVPDVIPDLATVLALRPTLKVLALNGYQDLATPFLQTERDLARLGSVPNLTLRYYDSGHMIYLDDAARVRQKQDLRLFYTGGSP